MRIQNIFRWLAVSMVVTTLALAGYLFAQQWQEHAQAKSANGVLTALSAVLTVAEKVSAERGPSNAALGAVTPAAPALAAALARARRDSDERLRAAVVELARPDCVACAVAAARLAQARLHLSAARAEIDRLLAHPLPERRQVQEVVRAMFAVIDEILPAADSLLAELQRIAPVASQHASNARYAAELREYAGRAGSEFTSALVDGRPLRVDEREKLAWDLGRVQALGDQIRQRVGNHAVTTEALTQAVSALDQRYLGAGLAYLKQTAELGAGQRQPTTAELAHTYVPLMTPIVGVRDTELELAGRVLTDRGSHALRLLLILGSILSLGVGAVATMFWLFSRRVLLPLTQATVTIVELAGGQYGGALPTSKRDDEIGGIFAALARLRDTLRRKAALESEREDLIAKLQAQLDFQRTLIDAIPIPISVKDRNGRYLAINLAVERWAGMDQQSVIGYLPTEVNMVGHGAAEALEAGTRQALTTGLPQEFTVDYSDADGRSRHFLAWAQPFTGTDTKFAGVISAAVDVTEIHEARQRALQLEQRLKDITDSLPVIVYQARRLDGSDGSIWEIIYAAGGGGANVLGLNPETLTGRRSALTTRIHPDDIPSLLAKWHAASQSQQPLEIECRLRGEKGMRWINMRAVPREHDSEVIWNGVIVDVTDRQAQAQALQAAKEAAEASLRAKESFLAMMSHEIRTPMNGILGLMELLQTTTLTTEQRRMVGLTSESGRALAQILDDILDYAKIEAGRLRITTAPLDLRELFDGVLSALLPQAFQKGLHLKQTVSADVPAKVQGDAVRLRQILFNLLGNAIKFTERGSVMLRATVEHASGQPPMLLVAIEDTGIGIPREDLGNLFAPFVQSEHSATRRFGGTGLGLAISRMLAELMEGQINLQSTVAVGTTAVLRVPCKVVRQDYDIPNLRRRALSVQTEHQGRRESLVAYGAAASMRVLEAGETPQENAVLIVEGDIPSIATPGHVIHLCGELLPLGYRHDDTGVWLSHNPLRWTAFTGALDALLTRNAPTAQQPPFDTEPEVRTLATPSLTILVVEDHPINQEVIQQQLRVLGYSTAACANGQEALAALEAAHYDLVVTDCHMPVMNGFDLTRAIRASDRPSVSAMPVVGLTATIAREEHLLCTIVGMDAFLIKPATLAGLRDTIETAFQRRSHSLPATTTEASSDICAGKPVLDDGEFHAENVDDDALLSLLESVLLDQAVRDRFVHALKADRDALVRHLATQSSEGLAEWCHRAGGGVSALGQPYLLALVNRFDALVEGNSPAANLAGQSLVDMYDYLLRLVKDGERQ